jgi:hypothetical protein
VRDNAKLPEWKHVNAKHFHKGRRPLVNESGSTVTPDKPELRTEISTVKAALDAARQVGDKLREDLYESSLNDLLDRYHSYHTQRRDK